MKGKKAEKTETEKINIHGRTFTGTVVSDKSHKTVTVEWERRLFIPKYERYEKRRSKVKAHNPESIAAEEGDVVVIKECRPLSKTKHFIVIEKKSKDVDYLIEQNEKESNKKIVEEKEDKPKKKKIKEEK